MKIGTMVNRYFQFMQFFFILFIANVHSEYNELKMVHVIFRHGERTPVKFTSHETYPNDPHFDEVFFPIGRGGLTNDGKTTMYNLGKFLRKQYNDFLGDLYYPGVQKVRSSHTDRGIMSAQLVNAGLWPPAKIQQWNKDLLWIPIPYEYGPAEYDYLMKSYTCPNYIDEYERLLETKEIKKLIEPHLEFFDFLSLHTGLNVTTPQQVFFLYHTLISELNSNLTLPSWANGYFPGGEFYNVTLLYYRTSVWQDRLKRIYGGPLLRDILDDYKELIEQNLDLPKLKMYSGHESNICSVLGSMNLFTPHIPDFSAAIIFELYSNEFTNEFGIKILYYLGKSGELQSLKLPGCTEICPIDKFTHLLSRVIPKNVNEVCGVKNDSFKNQSFFTSLNIVIYIICLFFVFCKITYE